MEWSIFQDSEETIHSAEKKLTHMKAFSLCIDKKQKNVFFQLRQFSIFFDENWELEELENDILFSFLFLVIGFFKKKFFFVFYQCKD